MFEKFKWGYGVVRSVEKVRIGHGSVVKFRILEFGVQHLNVFFGVSLNEPRVNEIYWQNGEGVLIQDGGEGDEVWIVFESGFGRVLKNEQEVGKFS